MATIFLERTIFRTKRLIPPVFARTRSPNRAAKNKQGLSPAAKAAIDGSSAGRFAVRLGSDIDDFPGSWHSFLP